MYYIKSKTSQSCLKQQTPGSGGHGILLWLVRVGQKGWLDCGESDEWVAGFQNIWLLLLFWEYHSTLFPDLSRGAHIRLIFFGVRLSRPCAGPSYSLNNVQVPKDSMMMHSAFRGIICQKTSLWLCICKPRMAVLALSVDCCRFFRRSLPFHPHCLQIRPIKESSAKRVAP